MMGLEANRDAAIRLLQNVAKGRLDMEILAEDAVWWVPGRPEMPLAQFRPGFEGFMGALGGEGRMEIHAITAEENRFAIEAESFFPLKDGRTYNNTYHFLVEFRDGRVTRVKEYCDTALVQKLFGGG
jgi:ketosteroid isomerase-like protein